VQISGLSYFECVKDIYHLLLGENSKNATKEKYYRISREDLKWKGEYFFKIFSRKINAEILEDLTDKFMVGKWQVVVFINIERNSLDNLKINFEDISVKYTDCIHN